MARAVATPASANASLVSSGVLADDDTGKRGDLRSVVPELVGEQHDDVLAVAVGEFPGDAVGERVVAADDEMAPGHGGRGHGQIY